MTFIQVRNHDVNTPQRWVGNTSSVSCVFGSWTTVNFAAPSTDDMSMGSGASLTVQVTGWYTVLVASTTNAQNFSGARFEMQLLKNGSAIVGPTSFPANNQTGAAKMYYSGALTSGDTIALQVQDFVQSNTFTAAACEITFVPIPAHPN